MEPRTETRLRSKELGVGFSKAMEVMLMVEELTADWAERGKPTKTLKFNVSGLRGMTEKLYLHRQHNDQDKDSHKHDVEPPKACAVVFEAT